MPQIQNEALRISAPLLDLNGLLDSMRATKAREAVEAKRAKAQKHQSAREKARRKELRIGEYAPENRPTLKQIVAAMEDARQWRPQAIVLYVQRQFCQCGEEHKNIVGLFVRSRSDVTKADKLSPINGLVSIDLYPRELKETHVQVPACHVCYKAQDLVDLVFNGIATPPSGQTSLFNSLL